MGTKGEPILVTVIRWAVTALGAPMALMGGWLLGEGLFRVLSEGVYIKMGQQFALGVILLGVGLGLVRAAWKDPSLERLADRLR